MYLPYDDLDRSAMGPVKGLFLAAQHQGQRGRDLPQGPRREGGDLLQGPRK